MLFHCHVDNNRGIVQTYCDDCLPFDLLTARLIWAEDILPPEAIVCDECGQASAVIFASVSAWENAPSNFPDAMTIELTSGSRSLATFQLVNSHRG